jgi:phosphate transport system substrate-binding protein
MISGIIRIWGDDQMQSVVRLWATGFRHYQPQAKIQANLFGTGTGMAGLYTGVADLAFMGRKATAKEVMAFEWVFKYKPLEVEIMTGSLNVPGKSPALVVFTNKANPISKLSFSQLEAIFSCEQRAEIRKWGQLGLGGKWVDKPIHAYGYDTKTGSALFFNSTVLRGSGKWNWEQFRELQNDEQILHSLAEDPYGIALSTLAYGNPTVKPIALSSGDRGPYYEPTRGNIVAGRYSLTRYLYAYLNRAPGRPATPTVREFLRYILSRDGQLEIARGGEFLPLNRQAVKNQLRAIQ